MAKASIPGRVKTRLVPALSAGQAAELNTAFLSDIAENLVLAGTRAKIAPFMSFGPPGSVAFFEEHLPHEIGLLEMWYPDFGECLCRTIDTMLGLGYGSACVLNSDSPTLPTHLLSDAAEALARPGDRAVLGPSDDGGYYLLGLKAQHLRVFEDIAWSTDVVAEQTIARAAEIALEVVVLPTWYDVDDANALERLAEEIRAGESMENAGHWPRHSATALHRLHRADEAFPFPIGQGGRS